MKKSFILAIVVLSFAPFSIAETKRSVKANIEMSRFESALKTFYVDCGAYPSTEEGLQALVKAPKSCKNWGPDSYLGPYVTTIKNDPWNRPWIYSNDNKELEIKSLGDDGMPGGEGANADISLKLVSTPGKK